MISSIVTFLANQTRPSTPQAYLLLPRTMHGPGHF